MTDTLSNSAQKVQDALRTHGLECLVVEMPATTRTATEAASAIGCAVGQIAKSIVFRTINARSPILVIASGTNRVNENRISELVGETIEVADADYVRDVTGFVIGGIPPIGHVMAIRTFIDSDLLKYEVIWAAAGTPRAVFKLTPQQLQTITGGTVVQVL